MKMKKRLLRILLSLVLMLGLVPGMTIPAEAVTYNLTATVDSSSTYTPTTLPNGDFEDTTWGTLGGGNSEMIYCDANAYGNYSGTGWGTTDEAFEIPYKGSKYYSAYGVDGTGHGRFAEFNYQYPAVFYQDLHTYGGDVIRWKSILELRTVRILSGKIKINQTL